MVLALNRTMSPVALCNLRAWYEGTRLRTLYGESPLSSQALSEFLERVGESGLPMDFSRRLIEMTEDGSSLLYDIASLPPLPWFSTVIYPVGVDVTLDEKNPCYGGV